jgi:hypothetical protein
VQSPRKLPFPPLAKQHGEHETRGILHGTFATCGGAQRSLRRRIIVDPDAQPRCVSIDDDRGSEMTLGTVLLVVLILILIGVMPTWPHSRSWGYGPSGGVGTLLVILLILFVLGIV